MIKTSLNILDVAKLTLLYLLENGISVCPLKLQKILYYIQAWHLVYFDKQLLFDEKPEAWVNGPVYRSIYNQFKHIGIYDQIEKGDINMDISIEKFKETLMLDKSQEDFLEAIYQNYGTMPHDKLVFLTHAELPWSEKRKGLSPFDYSDEELSIDTMYSYYKERIDKKKK